MRQSLLKLRQRWRRPPWPDLLLLAVLAMLLRLPGLNALPPGLNFDEAGNGVAALGVLGGDVRLWWTIGGGKEPLFVYALLPWLGLFGPQPVAIRLTTALSGVAAVLMTYLAVYRLYLNVNLDMARFVARIAGVGMALAFWPLAFSRLGFRAMPMLILLALVAFWLARAETSTRRADFVLAGFFLGVLPYSYLAGRLAPLWVLLFWLLLALKRRSLRAAWTERARLVLAAGLTAAPLLLYFLWYPAQFAARAGTVSIFNPQVNGGDFRGTLSHTLQLTLGTFVGLGGDPNLIANLPGRPALDPGLGALFVLGVLAVVWRRHLGDQLLVAWWLVMLLPAVLAPEGAPHHLRLLGTAPPTFALVGRGLWLVFAASVRWPVSAVLSPGRLSLLVLLTVGVYLGWQTGRDYFLRWPQLDHHLSYDLYALELADHLQTHAKADHAFVLPMDLRAVPEARHYTLDYLLAGETRFRYLIIDEPNLAASLTNAAAGAQNLSVVRWTQDKHQAADEKALLDYLLSRGGAKLIDRQAERVYTLQRYTLPAASTGFAFPPLQTPIDITLDERLQVRRTTVEVHPAAVGVGVVFAPIAPMDVDYKASLRLTAPDGSTVAQQDRTLRHNWHQPTSLWPREEVNEYYLLSLPPALSPGTYDVALVVYDPDSLAPLTSGGNGVIELGQVSLP